MCLASTAEDNIVMVWQPSETFYNASTYVINPPGCLTVFSLTS